ncbi:hypothetical protein ACFQU7_43000 [Pseudoroseomonas wenyumeiae]
MQKRFEARGTGLRSFQVASRDELAARVGEADVVVVSGLWNNALLEQASKLRFVQSISAGVDQYGQDAFRAKACGWQARRASTPMRCPSTPWR